MTNLRGIIDNMRESIDNLENTLNAKEVKEATVESGFSPYFDRTDIYLWIQFTDGTDAILPIGWYQGEPNKADTEAFGDGEIVFIGE